ncbi:Dihydroneopterin triphosphate pyrophosphohydrolase type 2 (nudB) [Moritella sp. JT01]|nr:Dihydroneopterin triphosphate pyrophosphohydrolase type 2 (nudB) [Moritella sp. JT01]
METGETLQETALREINEESGLNVSQLLSSEYSYEYAIKKEWKSKYPKDSIFITEHVYSAYTDEIPTLSDEHSEFGWFNLKEAMELLNFGNNKEALSHVEVSLNS